MIGALCWIAPEITEGPAALAPFLLLSPDAAADDARETLLSKDRLVPETTPPVKVSSKPKGFPSAKTCWPTRSDVAVSALSIGLSLAKKSSPPLLPPVAAAAEAPPSKTKTARSCDRSKPTTAASRALRCLPSAVWATTRATVGPGERIPPKRFVFVREREERERRER